MLSETLGLESMKCKNRPTPEEITQSKIQDSFCTFGWCLWHFSFSQFLFWKCYEHLGRLSILK